MLEHEAKVEEGQNCQASMEAFRVVMQACLPETQGVLLYPLQLLTGDVPLTTILGMSATAQLQTVTDRGSELAPPNPSMSGIPVPLMGVKCQHPSSGQGVPALSQEEEEEIADTDDIPKEHPYKKWKDRRLVGKALKELQREAVSKESDMVKVARWAYHKAQHANFKQEGLYDLSSMFQQIATSTNLLGTKVHEVQEALDCRKTSGPPTE